jgi:hypothetical protein
MKRYKNTVKIGGKVVHSAESEWPYQLFQDAKDVIGTKLYAQLGTLHTLAEKGASAASFNVSVECVCLMNRRASRRAPEVIAAEKKAREQRQREKANRAEEARKEQQRVSLQRRRRITNQIDYAFKSGPESGSEPVSKYVTCQQCDAPVTFLQLGQVVPSGAAVLDESTVVGACCSKHSYNNPYYNHHYGVAEHFPVARLEFFYAGIRQIGIKGK